MSTYAEEVAAAKAVREAHEAAAGAAAKEGLTVPQGVRVQTFAALDAREIPEPPTLFCIGAIDVAEQETVLIQGPENVTKSLVAQETAHRVAMAGANVVQFQGEGGEAAYRKRLRRVALGLEPDGYAETAARITTVHGAFSLMEHAAFYRATIEAAKPKLVTVDPLVEYNAGDENSAQEMRAFLSVVAIARELGAAVILVHHSSKPDGNGRTSPRGSSVIGGFFDHRLDLARADDDKIVVKHEKNRERARAKPQLLSWRFTETKTSVTIETIGAEEAATKAARRHHTTILGVLAREGGKAPTKQLRAACGNLNSTRFYDAIKPLLDAKRVEAAEVETTDKVGRRRVVDGFRLLVPRTDSVAGTSACPPDDPSDESARREAAE